MGMYSVFLRDWFDYFPRDQMLIIFLEEYAANPNETFRKIFEFLGIKAKKKGAVVDQRWRIKNQRYVDIGPMRNDTRLLLKDFYAEYNVDLSVLMGVN